MAKDKDIDKMKFEGVVFKAVKSESQLEANKKRGMGMAKQKGQIVSGSAKMRAAYKARKRAEAGRAKK